MSENTLQKEGRNNADNLMQLRELTKQLNGYRQEYYNLNAPSISDAAYDALFHELQVLENTTGIYMANSPTQSVGYDPVSRLKKVTHDIPLLSLEKTKDIDGVANFLGDNDALMMLKLDGLTVKLVYENGDLVQASTRGNGTIGEDITHNAKVFKNIPLKIPYDSRLVMSGEAIIKESDFKTMVAFQDEGEDGYKNSRNLAAGSARLLDPSVCKDRNISFYAFGVLEGFKEMENKTEKLENLEKLGFSVCEFFPLKKLLSAKELAAGVEKMKTAFFDYPIDGIVFTYNNIAFSMACGRTGHHYKDSIAFKFEDDTFETTLTDIEWNTSRTGEIFPVAIFDMVEIDGCSVSRASLHNLGNVLAMNLDIGDKIMVSKRNMIIPHVEENLYASKGGHIDIPKMCPTCCSKTYKSTEISTTTDIKGKSETITLHCSNKMCEAQVLRKFVHFAEKKAMNIDGLSENTLNKLMDKGWLKTFTDIYRLNAHKEEMIQMDGFGEKSYEKLWAAIENSKNTTFENFLVAMDISMVGSTASRIFKDYCSGDLEVFRNYSCGSIDFSSIKGIGLLMNGSIKKWFKNPSNIILWDELFSIMRFDASVPTEIEQQTVAGDNPFAGKTIVATGKLDNFTRATINAKITSLGGYAEDKVSISTDYLIVGGKPGSKLAKAKSLGIHILTESEFLDMAGLL